MTPKCYYPKQELSLDSVLFCMTLKCYYPKQELSLDSVLHDSKVLLSKQELSLDYVLYDSKVLLSKARIVIRFRFAGLQSVIIQSKNCH